MLIVHICYYRHMDKKSLQLASRFSLPPNSKGYCGRDSAPAKFRRCLHSGNCSGVSEELQKFIVLTPYLKTLSEITGLDFDSYEVVESYWLGNDLLKKAKQKHFNLLLKNFKAQGVPDWYIKELRENRPIKFIPIHQFQVFHVGVGKASGTIPHNLDSSNNCMIRWGRVLSIENGFATLSLNQLRIEKSRYTLIDNPKTEKFKLDKLLTPNLKVNDIVAVHWDQIVKILTAFELYNLSRWTAEVLSTCRPPVFKKKVSTT